MFRSFDPDDCMSLAVLGNPPDCLRASAFANGVVQALGYDPVSRLTSLTNQLSGTAQDLTKTYTYNPASQITQQTTSNDAYAFVKSNVSETGTANGLNQLTTYAAKTLTHDTKGNITGFGTDTFAYSSENLMTSATVSGTATSLSYDPLLRLYQTVSGATTSRFAYDGLDAIAEYNGANALQRRWVFDPTTGQTLVWYEGTGTAATDRRYLSADERGSIISVSDSSGAALAVNRYDEYGLPAFGPLAGQRFGYAGALWLAGPQLWHLTYRAYHPGLGRFLQTDPVGYAGGINLYAYVGNDPVNWVDPLGLDKTITVTCDPECQARKNPPPYIAKPHEQFPVEVLAQQTVVVTGRRLPKSQKPPLHYRIQDFAFCSADALFNEFRKPGGSAPGAPYAQEGTHPDIALVFDNPITQIVDLDSRTITNVTQFGHRYHSGTVEISVSPAPYGSTVAIEGRGSGPHFLENVIFGKLIFTELSTRATIACTLGGF